MTRDPASASAAIRARVEFALYRAVRGALSHLDDAEAARFGAALGRTAARVSPRRDRLARANLAAAFPGWTERQVDETVGRCWEHFGRVAVDYLRLGELPPGEFLDRIEIEGLSNFTGALERRKGVFLLSAHLGHWEVGALAAGLLGEPISIVVRTLDNPFLEEELARHRSRYGNRVVPKTEAAREMLRSLRAGGTVAILVDQKVIGEEAVSVPFFGRPARTTPALARLAVKTGAAVVPVFCRPAEGGPGRYRLEFEPAILPDDLPEAEREVEPLTARFMEVTEAAIRRAPEYWLWMHNRWKGGESPPPEVTPPPE